ncbi:hypothetical protein P9112_005604 [Eukaryota sp. TZLM1-RC]
MKILFVALLVCLVSAKVYPRSKGYAIGNPSASVELEFVVSLSCPDSKNAFLDVLPVIKKNFVDDGHVQLFVSIFPLPFHYSCYDLSVTASVMSMLFEEDPRQYLNFLTNAFNKQHLFFNDPVFNMTIASRHKTIYQELVAQFGISEHQFFSLFFKDTSAKTAFKAYSSRGIYGAPFYYLNGVAVEGAEKMGAQELSDLLNLLI